ncbi:RHS repeat-associated core domain-containing protein [Providencia stuartii]|uniref:RHS repeat-associated core domain-containing protein n=2 Tax=Morganellaceae TaxID=1903414 RepID=UPI0034E46586
MSTRHPVSLLTAEEAENVRQWAEERKQDLTKWATQTSHEVSAAIDSPFEGLSGALKETWNVVPDVLDLAYTGAQIIEITGSVLGSKIAGLFNAKWQKQLEDHAQLVRDQFGESPFDAIRFTELSDAEKGGAFLMMFTPVGLVKKAGKKLGKELTQEAAEIIGKTSRKTSNEVADIANKAPSSGGTVKPNTNSPSNKTSDTPSTKVNEDTKKTQKNQDGKGNDTDKVNTCGDPVDIVRGDLIQAWSVINIPGLLPIELTRTYYSTQSPNGIFGKKWADNWSMYLLINDNTIDFQDPEGSLYTFTAPNDEVRSRNLRAPHYLLLGNKQTGLQIQDNRRQRIYHFDTLSLSCRRLVKITNLQGIALHFHYDDKQQLSHILRDDGFLVRLHYQHNQLTHINYEHAQQIQRLVTCQYDNHGYLSECDAFQQNHLWHTYTPEGWMTSWRDTDQTELTICYDKQGRVIQTHSDSGYWCDRFLYDDTLQINTYIDGEGGHYRYYYNEDQLVVRTLDPLGRETRTQWRDFQKISETNDTGETTHYIYHVDGLLAQIHLPDKRKVGYEYNDNGQLTRYIAPTGDEWQLSYDTQGNLTAIIDPQGQILTYEYSQHGELLKAISPDGAQWQYEYNAAHQLIKSTNPYQNSTEYQFDELGRLQAYTDALKHTTRYRYSQEHDGVNGSVSDVLLPDGTHQHIEYDSERRVVAVTDGEGRTTRYRYGPFDLLMVMVRPDGSEIHFEYDALTRLKKVISALGETYTYERDAAGQIIRETDFTGRVLEYRYDRLGRRIATRYPDNHELRWRYASSGVIIEQSEWVDDGINTQCLSTTTYEYDTHLRLVKATNPDSVVEFEYNAHGQLTCERINGREVHHQWDEATHTLTQTRFGERELHYAFGQLGELTSLQVGQHAPLRFSYNAVGQEYLRRSDAGFVNSSHYNAAGLLAHQRAGRGSENFLRAMQEAPHLPPVCTDVHRSFHYDRAHNVVGIEDTRWQRTQYRYNANDQITETQYSNQHRSQYERFQYDANLNLIEHTVVPEGAQVALHQLSQQQQAGRVIRRGLPRGYQDYHYDVNGRLAKKVVHQHGYRPQEWRYLWNTQNQLIRCFTPSGDVWRYTYDAFGRRLSKTKTVDSEKLNAHPAFPVLKPRVTAWHYLWSGDQMVEEAPVYADGTVAYDAGIQWLYQPGAITPTARYQKGQLHYVVTDHQGTPREIFTEKGIASWAGRLNTWGQMAFWQSQDGRADNDPNYTECHFRFAGQYEDRETGLYYNRFRYYDKDSGQYISPDPIGLLGGLNPYGYVHCPTGFIDPLGLAGYCCNELLKEDRFRRHHSSSAIYLKHTKAKTQEEAMMFSSGGKPAQYWDIDAPNGKVTGSSMTSFRNKTEKEALRYGVYSPQKGGSDYYIYDAGRTIGFNNGQPTQYMRVEVTKSTNEFHGHPISNQTYNDYMRKVE